MSQTTSVALSVIGMAIEALGIWIFTSDVLDANREALEKIEEVSRSRPVAFSASALIGYDDGRPLQFEGAELAVPADASEVPKLRRTRLKLRVGAMFLASGIAVQAVGTLWNALT